MQRITPNLWFDDQAEEAARFYTAVFKNSRINTIAHYGSAGPLPAGTVMMVEFELDGQEFTALNGGPADFAFNEALSLIVNCASQGEVDYYWKRLGELLHDQAVGQPQVATLDRRPAGRSLRPSPHQAQRRPIASRVGKDVVQLDRQPVQSRRRPRQAGAIASAPASGHASGP